MRLIDADAFEKRLTFLRKQAGYGMIATGIETAIYELKIFPSSDLQKQNNSKEDGSK
jgi:hypothetical protein